LTTKKKGVFLIFDLIGAFGVELGAKTLFKRGFYRNLNYSSLDFDETQQNGVGPMKDGAISIFRTIEPFRRGEG